MSITSNWPLPKEGIRFLLPSSVLAELQQQALTQDLYPIAMGYYPKAVGHRMKRVEHSNHLLLYCTEGSGWARTSRGEFAIKAGDIFCFPRDVLHDYGANNDDPWTIYWVHYDGNHSEACNALFAANDIVLQVGLQPQLRADFDGLLNLRHNVYSPLSVIHGAGQLRQLLAHIAVQRSEYLAGSDRGFDLAVIEQLMNRHIAGDIELEDLAAAANLSKYHFSRKFKQLTGHSPIQHFLYLKIQYGCHLLDTTTDSIKQVAASLGYSDVYYFSRLFKQVMGVPPTAYRRKLVI